MRNFAIMRDGFVRPSATMAVIILSHILASAANAVDDKPNTTLTPTSQFSREKRTMLLERLEAFDRLPPEEQERLRRLHQSTLPSADGSEQLKVILNKYERWLSTLTPEERQQLEQAPSSEARLVLVRSLVARQSAALEQDLEPLRAFSPPRPDGEPGGGPPRSSYFRQRLSAYEDQRVLLTKIEPLWSPAERTRMQTLKRSQRSLYVMALATKYDIPIPPNLREVQPPVFQLFMNLVEHPENIFGSKASRQLSDEARKQLGAFMVDILMLPNLDGKKRFEFLQQQPPMVRTAIETVMDSNVYAGQILVNAVYFVAHPDEAPEECRDSLALVNPSSALLAFGKTMLRDKFNGRSRSGPAGQGPRSGSGPKPSRPPE